MIWTETAANEQPSLIWAASDPHLDAVHGEQGRIWRLRGDCRQRTAAFPWKIEGLGWESERVAFRSTLIHGVLSTSGKRPTLQLKSTPPRTTPITTNPRKVAIYISGDAIGIGL
jgi:hypothetical protein